MQKEFSKFWRNPAYKNIELFHAHFRQFTFSKHWHDELAIGIIQRGAEKLDYRGQTAVIPQGGIVTINPGEIHTGYSGSDQGWHYRMFYFDMTLIEQVLREHRKYGSIPTPFLKGPIIHDPELFQLFTQLYCSLEGNHLSLATESLITLAINSLFTRHGDQKINPRVKSDKTIAQKIHSYICGNWQRNVTLEELCQHTEMSQYHLIRCFNDQYGIPPHQFLILIKTHQARLLLQQGFKAATVAVDCGFFDQSHLNRNFKKTFGITPGRYLRTR
ncbi:AraC family transcriptional regulator [Microbulbifer variabilis]|uniref:AraC family transcriptional regulator n=1 Tax=Microbulbifer variabilis TaxID=266805 RepID=UPI001CFE5B1F|nr:AraC family transcriptional regulator [Microbulbifer variabilis]